jgi:hypothetical protein
VKLAIQDPKASKVSKALRVSQARMLFGTLRELIAEAHHMP